MSGSWKKIDHETMAQTAASDYKIGSEYIKLMNKAAKWADEKYQETSCFHATKNYVKSLKFLYQCAGYLRKGQSVESSVMQASKDAKLEGFGVEKIAGEC